MLSYIASEVPFASPHSISLSLPRLPPDNTTDGDIVHRFSDDKDMLLYLLQSPGYFDVVYVEFDLLYEIISKNTIPIDRATQIANDIMDLCDASDAGEYPDTYRILYHVYKLTGDIKYGNRIVNSLNTCYVQNPITEVTVERVEECIDEEREDETLFLYSYLSFEDKVVLSGRVEFESTLFSTKVLEVMMPYYPHNPNYRIAYAMINLRLLDEDVDEISPAEYFLHCKYNGTIHIPVNDNCFGLDEVLICHLTEDTMTILQNIMSRLDCKSRAYRICQTFSRKFKYQ